MRNDSRLSRQQRFPAYSLHRKAASLAALALSVLLAQPALRAQDAADHEPDTNRLAEIQKRMQDYVDREDAAGIVTLVGRNGKVIQSAAVGMQNIEENKPMRKDSIFQIMSMTSL